MTAAYFFYLKSLIMLSAQFQYIDKNILIIRMTTIINNHIACHLGDDHKKSFKKINSQLLRGHFFLEILCHIFLATHAFAKFHAINNHNHLEL